MPWRKAADTGSVLIKSIIYVEVSIRFGLIENLDAALPPTTSTAPAALVGRAAFLAGKAFAQYRRAGETRGPQHSRASSSEHHAAIGEPTLVTRDPARDRTYVPTVRLISP